MRTKSVLGARDIVGMAAALVLVAAGLVAAWLHQRAPRGTPTNVLTEYVTALRGGDSSRASRLTTAEIHDKLMRELCAARFSRAKRIYDEIIPALASPTWADIRTRAEGVAITEALRLRAEMDTGGRERIGQLSAEQQEVLVRRYEMFEAFIVCAGHASLRPDDTEKISDPMKFWRATERLTSWSGAEPLGDDFITRAAWPQLTSVDRDLLGTREALESRSNPAKLECFDRIGKPLLGPRYEDIPGAPGSPSAGEWVVTTECSVAFETSPPISPSAARRTQLSPDLRPVIEGIERRDVDDLSTFVEKHGEATAREVLLSAEVGVLNEPIRETHPLLPAGSLLRRTEAAAGSSVSVRGDTVDVNTAQSRAEGPWTITYLSPALPPALAGEKP